VGGIWPAILGGTVSLVLLLVVSKLTKPPPSEVTDIFFIDTEDEKMGKKWG
jgi:hypothetical protein